MAVRGQVAWGGGLFWVDVYYLQSLDSRCSLDTPRNPILKHSVTLCSLVMIRCTSRDVSHMQGSTA
jgi:hypothetical protein